jgi:hypothetical protein
MFKLAVAFVLIASFCSVEMKSVDMTFQNSIDHKFVSTKTVKILHAGYYPDIMEL